MSRTRWLLIVLCLAGWVRAENLTLPLDQRPAWVAQDGIVMAGNWEPLLFRVRRDGSPGYTPTPQQLADYRREQSPEMVAELKALGVNFVMMHCYKGGGLQAERESMADAVRFAKLCHDAGLRVGVYNYSGAFMWELFFEETPEAREWLILDAQGSPLPYYHNKYRYFWNRNHPDAQAFYRKIVRFAVEEIGADLIHFDNHDIGPGSEPVSAERFRAYLRERFTLEQLANMDITDMEAVTPPLVPSGSLLRRAWLDFTSQSLADAYSDMCRYARTLRKDVLLECNPGGPGSAIRPPIDHGRLLQGGEALWDEGLPSGYHEGKLHTRIRTYKIARRMDNIAFAYTTTPLEMAESMAFNLDCLGCVCWFEYGRIVDKPYKEEPLSSDLAPYIRFFHDRRDLLRDAAVVADVAVLRNFPSQAYGTASTELTPRVEQALIEGCIPFQIIYDHHLADLQRYRALFLAECAAMSDRQIDQIRSYVASGGRLCVVGAAATHDEWLIPREKPALDDLPSDRVLRFESPDAAAAVAAEVCKESRSCAVDGPPGLFCELTQQKNRRLLHLVNYRTDEPAVDVPITMLLPAGRKAEKVTLVSPDQQDVQVLHKENAGKVSFTIPAIRTYTIAVVSH